MTALIVIGAIGAGGLAVAFWFSLTPRHLPRDPVSRVLSKHDAIQADIRRRDGTSTGNVRVLRPDEDEDSSGETGACE